MPSRSKKADEHPPASPVSLWRLSTIGSSAKALKPPEQRPAVFIRGCAAYDFANVGFVWVGPLAERSGFTHDTREKGNSNRGHLYGTGLSLSEIDDLLGFLNTP